MSGELGAIVPSSEELSGAELAARAGVGEQEIQRLVTHGVLVPRQGRRALFRAVDVMKIRVARACEEGGLPMEGIAKAIRAGHLSFAFIESWPFERWAARGPQTHAELATEVGLPFESLQRIVEAFGFARPEPGDAVVAAERPIAALIGRAIKVGLVDEAASVRFGNLYAEALRRIAAVETEVYHSGIEMPLLRSGLGERRTMELAER
jgi:MerR HTH family regulatory protein